MSRRNWCAIALCVHLAKYCSLSDAGLLHVKLVSRAPFVLGAPTQCRFIGDVLAARPGSATAPSAQCASCPAGFTSASEHGAVRNLIQNSIVASQQVRRMVQRLISDMKSGRKKVRSITVTGHSLGGALAVLCADDVGRQLQAQQRLDHAVRSSSELLKRCWDMPMPAEARDAIDEMVRSLAHAQETSEDVELSRISAASAVAAACEAICLMQEALFEGGYLRKQQRRTQQLLDLLAEAETLFNSQQLLSVAPAASKLHKAAQTVLHKQQALGAPSCCAAIGRGFRSIRALVVPRRSSQQSAPAGDAHATPAATSNGHAETQPGSTCCKDASPKSAAEADSHAAPAAKPASLQVAALQRRTMWRFIAAQQKQQHAQQPEDVTDTGWKIMLEAAAAHCSAAAALAMVSAQYGMPVPESGGRAQTARLSARSSRRNPAPGKEPDTGGHNGVHAVSQSSQREGGAATEGAAQSNAKLVNAVTPAYS